VCHVEGVSSICVQIDLLQNFRLEELHFHCNNMFVSAFVSCCYRKHTQNNVCMLIILLCTLLPHR